MSYEEAYRLLLIKVLNCGHTHNARNTTTKRLFNQQLETDLQKGFPMVTGRKLPWTGIKGELLSFIRGYTSLKDIQSMGCNFWNKNCEEVGTDNIGPAYGYQWRRATSVINTPEGMGAVICDQLKQLVTGLLTDPGSRRHILTASSPALEPFMVLPPCHCMAQWHVQTHVRTEGTTMENTYGQDSPVLHCTVTMRSADLFVGVPADMALYALLTELLAFGLNMRPGTICINMADCHIYDANEEQARAYLSKATYPLPEVAIENDYALLLKDLPDNLSSEDHVKLIMIWLEQLEPEYIMLDNYQANEPLIVTMVA